MTQRPSPLFAAFEKERKELGKCVVEMLAFHGTSADNAEAILSKGFIPSRGGRQGPGVYVTLCPARAQLFGKSVIAVKVLAHADEMLKSDICVRDSRRALPLHMYSCKRRRKK
jgi:hypothetical protein